LDKMDGSPVESFEVFANAHIAINIQFNIISTSFP
jgi:hypothetical protein